MAAELAGKVTLITKRTLGIWRTTAMAFAQEGARIDIADAAVARGKETAHLTTMPGGGARFIWVDVSQAVDVHALIGKAF